METTKESLCISNEFRGVNLGDKRLDRRLQRIAERVSHSPSMSLPRIFKNPSQLEGVYRFIENEKVDAEAILAPHQEKTWQRAYHHDVILVLHDTTAFSFGGGARDGMGVVDPTDIPGFYMHASFGVGLDGEPLGLCRAYAWSRQDKVFGKIPQSRSQYIPDRESLRWLEAVEDVEDSAIQRQGEGPRPALIHVMDREGDFIELLAQMDAYQHAYVIRGKYDRRLNPSCEPKEGTLLSVVLDSPIRFHCKVPVQVYKRTPGGKRPTNPEGKGGRIRAAAQTWMEFREAKLEIRAIRKRIYGGNGHHAHMPSEGIDISVVSAREVDASEGTDPLEWTLLTSLPVESTEDIQKVLNAYRQRWLIEEFFKALKSGCKYEEHQFETGARYMRMLAVYLPIAARMLRLRWFDRERGDASALCVLEPDELDALRAYYLRERKPLPDSPTVQIVMPLIARLGGHLPQNGAPGWLTLSRGFAFLHDLTEGWILAKVAFTQAAPLPLEAQRKRGPRKM